MSERTRVNLEDVFKQHRAALTGEGDSLQSLGFSASARAVEVSELITQALKTNGGDARIEIRLTQEYINDNNCLGILGIETDCDNYSKAHGITAVVFHDEKKIVVSRSKNDGALLAEALEHDGAKS
jgi:hypothetical protein